MLNNSHFRASTPPPPPPPPTQEILVPQSQFALRRVLWVSVPPHARSLSLLSWSFSRCLCHLCFVNPSLLSADFLLMRLSIYTPQVTTVFFFLSWNVSQFIWRAPRSCRSEGRVCSERIFDDSVTRRGPRWTRHLALIGGDQLRVSKRAGPGVRSVAVW